MPPCHCAAIFVQLRLTQYLRVASDLIPRVRVTFSAYVTHYRPI